MKLIVCLENNNGVIFNKRRVSSDKKVTKKIIELTQGKKLWVSYYTQELFIGKDINKTRLVISNSFFKKAGKSDYVFVENNMSENLDDCSELIIFRWNRDYPSDLKFDFDYLQRFELVSTEKFKGNSHDEITEEHYTKKIER